MADDKDTPKESTELDFDKLLNNYLNAEPMEKQCSSGECRMKILKSDPHKQCKEHRRQSKRSKKRKPIQKDVPCEICGDKQMFRDAHDLKIHHRRKHPDKYPTDPALMCELCSQHCDSQSDFNRHKKSKSCIEKHNHNDVELLWDQIIASNVLSECP